MRFLIFPDIHERYEEGSLREHLLRLKLDPLMTPNHLDSGDDLREVLETTYKESINTFPDAKLVVWDTVYENRVVEFN